MITEQQKLFFCELNHIKSQLRNIAEQWRSYDNKSCSATLEQKANDLEALDGYVTSGGEWRDVADYKSFLDDARIFMYRAIIDFEDFEKKVERA